MNAIEISGLSKTFKGKRWSRVEALKNLSLSVEVGEIFGFLGPNGAGKSTTIKTLMGLIEPSAGNARIMGKEISSPEARRQVGYLPENPAFYDYLGAQEYLNFVGAAFGMEPQELAVKTEQVLKQLELWEARKRPMRSYSKGMVQRVGLAQVLIHDPQVCILDEPMSGLDPVGRALVKEIMLDLKKRGKCVFFSTHIIADVESVCDRVGIILKGELQSVERVDDIMSRGVVGYDVTVRDSAGHSSERYVGKDELSSAMAKLQAEGGEVTLIEPRRKSLEDFFLDIIKKRG
ncbi:ABC transporter ATP-binding protein [Geomonas sp.]|uniref:ABC transporter ATP-binding protein n=1 Tax=Geomonas sp. TaxID=2651584 RepID=UPI002B474F2E|nr:ABC transporter ATP-binding protein [Geomonas sp.]HJV37182.1 ABC transporter ATP-binding protein [Geomonas sp.]